MAQRLAEAGVECYNHNLETSRRFFPRSAPPTITRNASQTIRHLKDAGIKICSGGILGMGETRQDRCDLAFSLREIGANVVPINILNPIPGTPFGHNTPLPPLEIFKTIACFRLILPRQEIMVAGGRAVNLRDLQSMIFMAGASAMMVGNYLTTLNQPVEKDLQMLRDLGLDPSWDKHGFSDQETVAAAEPAEEPGRARRARELFRSCGSVMPCSDPAPASDSPSLLARLWRNQGRYLGETIDIHGVLEQIAAAAQRHGWVTDCLVQSADFCIVAHRLPFGSRAAACIFRRAFTATNRRGPWRSWS